MSQTTAARPQAPGFYRFGVGAFQAVALHDGSLVRDRPAGFVPGVEEEVVAEAFAAAGLPRDKLTLTFSTLAVDTGSGVVLIDTGMGESGPPGTGMLVANLQAAGIAPTDVAHVLISHFHGDHISGLLRKDGSPTFPSAAVHVPEPEWAFWTDEAKRSAAPDSAKGNFDLVKRMFPDAGSVRRFAWDSEVLPGITAVRASGHTPGMTAFRIASEGEAVLFVADITNNPLIFARHAEWKAMFDMDGDETLATRRRLLDAASAEKQRLFFFHAPFPGLGTVVKGGGGYEYLPALWTAS